MFIKVFNVFKCRLYPKKLDKLKNYILKYAYDLRIFDGVNKCYIISLEDSSKIRPYIQFDNTLINNAIRQLENEEKIVLGKDDFNDYFVLTEETFNYLKLNQHPIKDWLKLNIFNILNFLIAIWGAISGTLALFFKQ